MTITEFIESGILEQYVMGFASNSEVLEVERMAGKHTAVKLEIDSIAAALEDLASSTAIAPNPVIKPLLMATIDYTERLKNGEAPAQPPLLSPSSKPEDYIEWLNRTDMVSTGKEDLFAKIIGYTPEVISAIVWIKNYAPHEVHDNEYERFLIVEGTCDIIVADKVNHLVPGDYFAIPLHKTHMVKVTSLIPCKVILQRIAA
jgi:mannose-6-phosphate isomerase-like protein (cupin superfamily)